MDSQIYCPMCFSSPAMEIEVDARGDAVAKCVNCFEEYRLVRNGNGWEMHVSIPTERLIGRTGMAILKQLKASAIPDEELDKETRKQVQKLNSLGLVRPTRTSNKIVWELTNSGVYFIGEVVRND